MNAGQRNRTPISPITNRMHYQLCQANFKYSSHAVITQVTRAGVLRYNILDRGYSSYPGNFSHKWIVFLQIDLEFLPTQQSRRLSSQGGNRSKRVKFLSLGSINHIRLVRFELTLFYTQSKCLTRLGYNLILTHIRPAGLRPGGPG